MCFDQMKFYVNWLQGFLCWLEKMVLLLVMVEKNLLFSCRIWASSMRLNWRRRSG